MLQWLSANIGTILIGGALLAVVLLIVRYLLRQRKAGKSSYRSLPIPACWLPCPAYKNASFIR